MDNIYVIVIVAGMVEEVFQYSFEEEDYAKQCFVNQLEQRLSNFDEYTQADIDECIENGYEGFGRGSVQLYWDIN